MTTVKNYARSKLDELYPYNELLGTYAPNYATKWVIVETNITKYRLDYVKSICNQYMDLRIDNSTHLWYSFMGIKRQLKSFYRKSEIDISLIDITYLALYYMDKHIEGEL